jgi:phosphoglycolate phosphatase-like HAD superfamily hydrolase
MYILVDLDHTVSNAFWRDSMIGTVSWDEYHEQSKNDKPFKKVVRLINSLAAMDYYIIAVTGRTEKHRAITIDWLLKNQVHIDEVLMRPDNIFLKNADMKIKLIEDRFHGYYKDIHFLIDDNEDTILAFSNLGITTLHIRNKNGNGQPN